MKDSEYKTIRIPTASYEELTALQKELEAMGRDALPLHLQALAGETRIFALGAISIMAHRVMRLMKHRLNELPEPESLSEAQVKGTRFDSHLPLFDQEPVQTSVRDAIDTVVSEGMEHPTSRKRKKKSK